MSEIIEEKKTEEAVEIVGIGFKGACKVYYFDPKGKKYNKNDKVVVETSRGMELGTVKQDNTMVQKEKITAPLKPIIRLATAEDLAKDEKEQKFRDEAARIFRKKVEEYKLDMNLVGVERTLDNAKMLFYFTCESRVDFRELVKDLASTFHTRIELRQIGIRDEAKMIGGIGVCGRKFCCQSFLPDFVQVSIKMAKEQNFSLNSAKVSGACGRLMCCLRYEHEVYEDALRQLPPHGSTVSTKDGVGVVVDTKPLAKEIKVKFQDGDKETVKAYKLDDVKVLSRGGKGKKDQKNEENDEE
jgi:cell fate regulator YaaT (PSP1 superfamily)